MKTEEELIWESYSNSLSQQDDFDTMEDIWSYYKDDNSISEIAEEFDMEPAEVKEALKKYSSYLKGDIERSEFGLDSRHNDNNIAIDPNKRSDSIDYDFNPEYDEEAIYGRSSSTGVKPKKNRPRFGLNRRSSAGEVN